MLFTMCSSTFFFYKSMWLLHTALASARIIRYQRWVAEQQPAASVLIRAILIWRKLISDRTGVKVKQGSPGGKQAVEAEQIASSRATLPSLRKPPYSPVCALPIRPNAFKHVRKITRGRITTWWYSLAVRCRCFRVICLSAKFSHFKTAEHGT